MNVNSSIFIKDHLNSQAVVSDAAERVPLTVLSYEDFERGDVHILADLKTALHKEGIFGIRGIPGFQEKVRNIIEKLREFSALPKEVKEQYAPNPQEFLGYTKGIEKFMRPDRSWVVDESKASYYALTPESSNNKWPQELDLKTPFQDIGALVFQTGLAVIEKVGLIGPSLSLAEHHIGRMLYYGKNTPTDYWCGAHFDHGLFTALLPAVYFDGLNQIPEPEEAGLFVSVNDNKNFKKVIADPDVMLFQVGEFAQLATNDEFRATEHRIAKPNSPEVERYTVAFFFAVPMDSEVCSNSKLTRDKRYGEGKSCTYGHWHNESMNRYAT